MKLSVPTERWVDQQDHWPDSGRHIMACFGEETIVVYQAYRESIGRFALDHQRFGGEFSMSRMTWIKPNFLWMMYRSDWARSEGQEVVLAIHLRRSAFDAYLAEAVPSSFVADLYEDEAAWKLDVKRSSVRLQWDPDHGPSGEKLQRRAIQIGLRGPAVERYVAKDIVRIEDATPFVREQRDRLREELVTPRERVYPIGDERTRARVGAS
jgi:hypothetical protein